MECLVDLENIKETVRQSKGRETEDITEESWVQMREEDFERNLG